MVIQDEVSTSGTINIPEQSCTIKSSGNENGLSSLVYPEITLSARQHTETADNSPEAGKAATMIKLDKPESCPRCNSMEAKLCYISNCNNINKSRYFCWSCQRYWTIGGVIRNLPIRAVQCKSKHTSSHPQRLTTPSDEVPGKPSETFSIACRERTRIVSSSCSLMRKNNVQHTIQSFPDPPYHWNNPTKELIPRACIPSFTNRSFLLNSAENGNCLGYTSPCFRKHSRDLNSPDEERNDNRLPKTMRIVIDPLEAAKSSIQTTLGVKPGKTDTNHNRYMFRAFQFRPEVNAEILEVNRALEANPVALLRSQRYREST